MKIKKCFNQYRELEKLANTIDDKLTKFKSIYEKINPGPIYLSAIIKAIDKGQELTRIDCNLYFSKELFQLTGKYHDFRLSHEVRKFPKNKNGQEKIDEKELDLEYWRFYRRFKKAKKYFKKTGRENELKELEPLHVQFLILTGLEFQKID